MPDSSLSKWFAATGDSMGMVTFATVIYMLQTDTWKLDYHPRTSVRLMIYLDALGFLVSYAGTCANDLMPLCSQRNGYALVADLFWSVKDAVKYGYVSYRALTICGYRGIQKRRIAYAAGAGSLVLYWIFMAQVYSFNAADQCAPHYQSNVPLVTLYLYWTVVDVVAAAMVMWKLRKMIKETQILKAVEETNMYRILSFREELRLILVSLGMCMVTVQTIVSTTNPNVNSYRIGTIVFVYCQLFLVIGSRKVAVGSLSESDGKADSKGDSRNSANGIGNRMMTLDRVQPKTNERKH
ncbi:hypothetical protein BJ741DRAFT_439116 [Chytriomyces cf. hyalinus JEL632]|nr:hypothetical protein BJ741DRAFT_439116 [Chytriomyces cf. hyalinus JEL632]